MARFVDGPLHGRTLSIPSVEREYGAAIHQPLPSIVGGHAEYQMIAVYVIYDNWPVRYIFDRITTRKQPETK